MVINCIKDIISIIMKEVFSEVVEMIELIIKSVCEMI